jgi:hypothetical protein
MIDFIPVASYASLYYYILLIVVLLAFFHSQVLQIDDRANVSFMRGTGNLLLIFVLFYIGLRPINGVFYDMMTYNRRYENFQRYGALMMDKPTDYFFDLFTLVCSKIMTVEMYFFTCALLYIVPLWSASKKWFGNYSFYGFLTLVISFSFWNFGTNGIRNGIATSLFLLAISQEKRVLQIILILIAINFHKSIALAAFGFVLANIYNKPKYYLLFWLLCIPLSLTFGTIFQTLFSGFMEDDRASYLTDEVSSESFSNIGFRWDFLLYSASAVYAGWFYIFKRKFQDKFYNVLYCTYLFANAFWILVIQANFSNRFAYLSWFMMAVVIFYPLLKKQFLRKQYRLLGFIFVGYFAFTFLMNVILIK